MYSSQFNLTRMFLNSFVTCCLGLAILFHLLVSCRRVDWIDCLYVCRVCFDCASHQWCTVGIYCTSTVSEWPCFQRKKWTVSIKKIKKTVLVSPDVNLTSVVIRQLHLTWQLTSVLDNPRQCLTSRPSVLKRLVTPSLSSISSISTIGRAKTGRRKKSSRGPDSPRRPDKSD